MASNPLYNTNDSPNGATQPSKAVNDMQVFVNRNRNTFDLSYFNFKTQRFGQYEPFFVMEGVPGDTIPLHSSHQVRSLPMKSPFLSSLILSKDYFMVPMQAILPNTWEMIYANPASGDDVPDDANCYVDLFRLLPFFSLYLTETKLSQPEHNKNLLRIAFILEMFFSTGGLLASLGFPLHTSSSNVYYDDSFETFLRQNGRTVSCTFTLPNGSVIRSTSKDDSFADVCRQYLGYISTVAIDGASNLYLDNTALRNFLNGFDTQFYSVVSLNLSRVLAYQVACQQFYVNTKIDPIYNAQIYRDNFFFLLKEAISSGSQPATLSLASFTRNGISVPYDYFSGHYFDLLFDSYEGESFVSLASLYNVFEYILNYRNVLKFGDYFSSCRTQPLGTDVNGQMNAPVVGDKVAAIDMSKSIVMQRFLNNVVKLGNDFGEYLRGIFGREPSPDYHFPKFISHQEFDISGFEVANSADTHQGKLITNLNSGSDKYAFEITVDMPCIILGISNFNCPRVYSNARNRFFFHKDRFDDFNPMLQYIGDQPVIRFELTTRGFQGSMDPVFGYQSRNSEYKQNFSIATGGFLKDLPSWAFIVDSKDYTLGYLDSISGTQGPDFIRVSPYEFNRFFSALSGLSLGNAFHFIVVYNNKVMASRPMAVNPSIL